VEIWIFFEGITKYSWQGRHENGVCCQELISWNMFPFWDFARSTAGWRRWSWEIFATRRRHAARPSTSMFPIRTRETRMKISKQVGWKGIGGENSSFHWYSQLLSSLIHPTYRHGHVIRMKVVSVVVPLDRVFLGGYLHTRGHSRSDQTDSSCLKARNLDHHILVTSLTAFAKDIA